MVKTAFDRGFWAITLFMARLALTASLSAALLTVLLVAAFRILQPPLPRLLYSNNLDLYLRHLDCSGPLDACAVPDRLLLTGLDTFAVAQWSPDGDYIAVKMDDRWMIYRAACLLGDETCQPYLLDSRATDIRLAWGPDGSALAYMADPDGSTLRIVTRGCWDGSPAASCVERTVTLSGSVAREPDWSADGARLAFVTINMAAFVTDMACIDHSDNCAGSTSPVATQLPALWPSLSADGTLLVYSAGASHITEQIYLLSLTTGERRQLTFREADSTMPDWSNDDRYVTYGGFPDPFDGNMNIYVLDLWRGLDVLAVRNPGRDMYPNWGP